MQRGERVRRGRWYLLGILALVLGVGAGLWMGRHLPWGAWARTDSVAYIQAASHLVQGRGLTVYDANGRLEWLAHFPPVYPLTLAAWMKAGLVWHQATRWNSALAYGLFTALLALTMGSIVRRLPETLVWTAAVALMPPLVLYFTGAMSEGWFFVFLVLTLYGWWCAIFQGSIRAAWGAGVAAGLAVLTRYAGLFLVGGVLFLGWGFPGSLRARGKAAGAFLAPIAVLYALWQGVMRWMGTGLRMRFPPAEVWLQSAVDLVRRIGPIFWQEWLWLRRGEVPLGDLAYAALPWLFALAPLVLGVVAGWWWRAHPGEQGFGLAPLTVWAAWTPREFRAMFLWAFLWAWSALGYMVFLYFAHVLRDPPAAYYGRVVAPFLFLTSGALLSLGFAALAWVEHRLSVPSARFGAVPSGHRVVWVTSWGLAALALLFQISYLKAQDYLAVMQTFGNGYTRKVFHDPAFWARLRAWPEDILFVSTEAYATMLWTGRFTAWPPEAFNPKRARGPFGSRVGHPWHDAFREGRAVLIHLKPAREMWWEARMKERGSKALDILLEGLPVCWDAPLGTLYFKGPADPTLCPQREEGP